MMQGTAQTLAGQVTRNVLDSMRKIEQEDRGGIPSREGRHRPYTRGGGYNRVGHDRDVKDEMMRGLDKRYLHWGNSPEKKAGSGSRGTSRTGEKPTDRRDLSRGDSRGGMRTGTKQGPLNVTFSEFPDVAASLSSKTNRGIVSSDWPYNRGQTPPRVDPEANYAPIDGRDENGARRMPDGRVKGRAYVAAHSHAIETAGGFLNGLPRAGTNFRPARVCGKGVKEQRKTEEDGAEFARLAKSFDERMAAKMMKVKANKEKSAVDLDDVKRQISTGRLDLSMRGGHGNGQPIELVPDVICHATGLQAMDLSENKISRLPDTIANLRSLTVLNIDGNGLVELPQSFGWMGALTTLSLRNNMLTRVPHSFVRLSLLSDLDLSANKFLHMPPEVPQLAGLATLTMAANVLATEPLSYAGAAEDNRRRMPSLCALCRLHTLNLESNRLSLVPCGLEYLTRLRCLRLAHNRIVSTGTADTIAPALDAAVTLTKLSLLAASLTALDLSNNFISSFPAQLCALTRLLSLDLRCNRLPALPEALSRMVALSNLYLDRNPVAGLPHCVHSMWWLTTLSTIHLPIGPVQGLLGGGAGVASSWRRGHFRPDPRVMRRLEAYHAPPDAPPKGARSRGSAQWGHAGGAADTDGRYGSGTSNGCALRGGGDPHAASEMEAMAGPDSASGPGGGPVQVASRLRGSGSARPLGRRDTSEAVRAGSMESAGRRDQDDCWERRATTPTRAQPGPGSRGRTDTASDRGNLNSRGLKGVSLDTGSALALAQAAGPVEMEFQVDIPLGHTGPKCKMAERVDTADGDSDGYKWWRWAATTPYVHASRLSGAM